MHNTDEEKKIEKAKEFATVAIINEILSLIDVLMELNGLSL